MNSPKWKVYDSHGKYQASCKEPEAAACLMTLYGKGSTIRLGHSNILWREGEESQLAGNSYDECSLALQQRERELNERSFRAAYGTSAQEIAKRFIAHGTMGRV